MARRKKSVLDLSKQWAKIFDNLERDADGRLTPSAQQRYNRAFDTYQRYDRNIRDSKDYNRAFDRSYDKYLAANPNELGKNSFAREAGHLAGVQVKVSRATYMGLANNAG